MTQTSLAQTSAVAEPPYLRGLNAERTGRRATVGARAAQRPPRSHRDLRACPPRRRTGGDGGPHAAVLVAKIVTVYRAVGSRRASAHGAATVHAGWLVLMWTRFPRACHSHRQQQSSLQQSRRSAARRPMVLTFGDFNDVDIPRPPAWSSGRLRDRYRSFDGDAILGPADRQDRRDLPLQRQCRQRRQLHQGRDGTGRRSRQQWCA